MKTTMSSRVRQNSSHVAEVVRFSTPLGNKEFYTLRAPVDSKALGQIQGLPYPCVRNHFLKKRDWPSCRNLACKSRIRLGFGLKFHISLVTFVSLNLDPLY